MSRHLWMVPCLTLLVACEGVISAPPAAAPAKPAPQQQVLPPAPEVVPDPPPPRPRPVAFHTRVAGARFWLDGAQVPAIELTTDAAGNTPIFELPASLTAFNVHASKSGYPQYGVVAHVEAAAAPLEGFFGDCPGGCSSGGNKVFVGPAWTADVAPVPPVTFTRAQILDTQGDLMIWGGPDFALKCVNGQDPETGIKCVGDNGAVPRGLLAGWVWSLSIPRYPAARREALYQKILASGYTHVAIQVTKCRPESGYHGLYPTTATDCAGSGAKLNTVLKELIAHKLIPWCTGITQDDPPEDGLDHALCLAVLDDWDNTDQKDCHLQAMAKWFPDALLWIEMPDGVKAPRPDACSPSPFPASGGDWIRRATVKAPNFVGVAYEFNQPDGYAANLAALKDLNAFWRDLQQNRFETDTYWKFWDAYDVNDSRAYNDWFNQNAPWLQGFMSGGSTHPAATPSSYSGGIDGELDLKTATLEHMAADFAAWPITTRIKKVELTQTGVRVELDNGRPDAWPDTPDRPDMGALLYTLGIAEKINGQWHASAPIQLWRGLAESGGPIQAQTVPGRNLGQIPANWFYDGRWGAMSGYQVKPGEQIAIFVCAGDCRDGNGAFSPVHERSNAVLFKLPGAQGGTFQ